MDVVHTIALDLDAIPVKSSVNASQRETVATGSPWMRKQCNGGDTVVHSASSKTRRWINQYNVGDEFDKETLTILKILPFPAGAKKERRG